MVYTKGITKEITKNIEHNSKPCQTSSSLTLSLAKRCKTKTKNYEQEKLQSWNTLGFFFTVLLASTTSQFDYLDFYF